MNTRDHTNPPLAIEPAVLRQVVRVALDSSTAEVEQWQARPAGASWGAATAGIYRIGGTARAGDDLLQWSVVLKIIRPAANSQNPASLDETHPLYWKREALAYSSGLLDDLPGGVCAPRCFAYEERDDGSCRLWLEEAREPYGSSWSLAQYTLAARCLGRFNGAYLSGRPLPCERWLGAPGALRGLLDAFASIQDVLRDPATWQHPPIATAFPPDSAERLLRLWADRALLIDVLDRLPITFCHKDAFRKNMFLPAGEGETERLVLIDWSYVGHGEVGLDLADLFGASVSTFCVADSDPRELDSAIFRAYLSGLHDAGWHGDPRMVRFSFTASTSLKYGGLLLWMRDLAGGRDTAGWETLYGRPIDDIARQHGGLVAYLLDLADEARALLHRF